MLKKAKFGDWSSESDTYAGKIKVIYQKNKNSKPIDISSAVEAPIIIFDDDGKMEKLLPKLNWKEVN